MSPNDFQPGMIFVPQGTSGDAPAEGQIVALLVPSEESPRLLQDTSQRTEQPARQGVIRPQRPNLLRGCETLKESSCVRFTIHR